MTFPIVLVLGVGAILLASAFDNTPILTTLQKILSGQPLDLTGGSGGQSSGGQSGGGPYQGISYPTGSYPWVTSYPVTQAHGVNGETGIDIGTPFHTPITSLGAGTVVSTYYDASGGNVWVAVKSGLQTVYFNYLHLDQIAVNVGQSIGAGTFIGLSGGQTSGGSHPTDPTHSTGPHTEFGIYRQPNVYSLQNAFDPTAFIDAIRKGIQNAVTQL